MKKFFIIVSGFFLLVGTGCKTSSSDIFTTSSPSTAVSKPGSHWVDYKYLDKHLSSGENIKEVKKFNDYFGVPHYTIYKEQITKYFALSKATFAVFQSTVSNPDNVDESARKGTRAGVLYALNDDKQWHIFFEINNRSETDRNNPYYIWNEGKKINILIHDMVGANNNEGTAKIVSSDDLGKTWKIDHCFYLNWSVFHELEKKNNTNFLKTLDIYLNSTFKNSQVNEQYQYNPKTGNFELVELEQGLYPKFTVIDACKNIILP